MRRRWPRPRFELVTAVRLSSWRKMGVTRWPVDVDTRCAISAVHLMYVHKNYQLYLPYTWCMYIKTINYICCTPDVCTYKLSTISAIHLMYVHKNYQLYLPYTWCMYIKTINYICRTPDVCTYKLSAISAVHLMYVHKNYQLYQVFTKLEYIWIFIWMGSSLMQQ